MISTTRVSSVVRAFPVLASQSRGSRTIRTSKPRPVTLLPALEAGTRLTIVLCGPPTAVRELDSDFVPHEEPFVVLGDALLGGLPALEFYETIAKPIEEGEKLVGRLLVRTVDAL